MKKTQIISISSFKGGTAKTSSVIHVGSALARFHNQKVLLIDFDAQANLTTGLGFDPDENDSMAPVLQKKKELSDVILKTDEHNLDLVPADTWLERVEVTETLASDRYSHERLRDIIQDAPYDFIIIDTPPSLCWLTESALIAAGHTLICATPEFYSIKGLERLSQFIESINERHPLNILGVLLSFWNTRGKNNSTFLEVIEATFPEKMFKTHVRRDSKVSEASIHGKPLFNIFSKSRAAEDYKEITKQIVSRLKQQECQAALHQEVICGQC